MQSAFHGSVLKRNIPLQATVKRGLTMEMLYDRIRVIIIIIRLESLAGAYTIRALRCYQIGDLESLTSIDLK